MSLNLYAGPSLTKLPSPVSVVQTKELIWSENTGRAQSSGNNAKMVGDVVAEKRTFAIQWGVLENSDYTAIANLLTPGFFNFGMGSSPTSFGKFYRSEISGDCLPIGDTVYWKGVSVSVIEQ